MAKSIKKTTVEKQPTISPEFINRLRESAKRTELLNTELVAISKLEFEASRRKSQAESYYNECIKADRSTAEEIEKRYGKIQLNLSTGEYVKLT